MNKQKNNILKRLMNKKVLFIFFLIALFFNDLKSQTNYTLPSPYSDFVDTRTLPNKDTVVYNRKIGEWWFGFLGGLNANLYFGNMQIPRNPYRAPDVNNFYIDFPTSIGTGLFFGLKGDLIPKDKDWGVSLKIILLDYRNTEFESAIYPDSLKTRWRINAGFNYLTISPSMRYNLPITGLHLLGGLDFEFLTSSKFDMKQVFVNGSEIEYVGNLPTSAESFRFGGHIGIGFDMFAADINKKVRAFLTPYLTLQAGTNVFTNYSSSRNTVLARIGIQVRFGVDEVKTDTLYYDPYYEEPPQFLASVREEGIAFKGFQYEYEALAISSLKMIEEPVLAAAETVKPLPPIQISEEKKEIKEETLAEMTTTGEVVEESVATSPTLKEMNEDVVIIPEGPGRERRIVLKMDSEENFSFQRSNATQLTASMRLYLDAIAEYLKRNPNARIRVVGHSDDLGSTDDNERRARERADNVVNYLVRHNINRRRILDDSKGARDAAVAGFTETARSANRRIEITIIK